jgi:hypothetical protein
VSRNQEETNQMQPNDQLFRNALTSAVGGIAKQGYVLAADARLLGIENALKRWTSLTKEDKSKLWSAMQPGKFVLYAGTMFYLTQCANKSTVPTWDLAKGQCMRTGVDDSGLFGLESAQFDLDTAWMNGIQLQRLEAARARWVDLHRADIEVLVAKLVDSSANLHSLSQKDKRVLLRETRQVWNDDEPHLSESQKSSLQSVISNVWRSICPRWWEFHLRSRPKELREGQ